MAKRKPKSKRPQPQHKKQKKSQHDKHKRLQRKNSKRKKTTRAKVPLVGPMHDAVALLQACLDRRIAFRLAIIIAGMFLDSTTATLLVVPVLAPPLVLAGVDPVPLGIIAIFNLMFGLLTPPMGLSLFLLTSIAQVSLRQLLRALLPFYVPLLATLAIITFAEDLVLWLPGMLR